MAEGAGRELWQERGEVDREAEERVMGRMIYSFIIGFLFNSVLMRITGKVPGDDLIYPAAMLVLCVVGFIAHTLRKGGVSR